MAIGIIWGEIWNELIWDTSIWAQVEGVDDTTPVPFTFTDQAGVALSSTIVSNSITVAGINAPAQITISGGSYDINGSGVFVSTAGNVNSGDTIRVSHTSSASYLGIISTTLTIGGVSDSFSSQTLADPTPVEITIFTPRSRTFSVGRFG